MDARAALTKAKTLEIARWRTRNKELALLVARAEAVRLANHAQAVDAQLPDDEQQLDELVLVSEAAPLLEEKGLKPSVLPNA